MCAYFAALGGGVGLLVLVGAHAKVLDRLTGVPLATEENGVGAGWRTESELVEGQGLTAGVEDALLCGTRETEGSNCELGNLLEADIIGDGTDSNNDFRVAVLRISGLLRDARQRDRRTVDFGLEETLEDYLQDTTNNVNISS